MTDSPNNVHIVVPKEMRDRLKARRKSHQALAGVIDELLDIADKYEQSILPDKSGQETTR